MFYRNSIAITQAYEHGYNHEKHQRKGDNHAKMDSSEFRKRGKEMVDYIADYMDEVGKYPVSSSMEPGYMSKNIPNTAPRKPEEWSQIMKDVNEIIMPGITHWQHPHFHAYFPAGNSYPSILGDMLSDALGVVGFSWAASPACAELEVSVMDWVGKMIGLPGEFLHEDGIGGGVIQGSASECILVTLLAARHTAIRLLKVKFPFIEDGVLLSKLIAYSSKLAHSSVEKAGMIGFIKMRQLDVDENYSLRGSTLQRAIDEDRRLGLIPFYVCGTLGTTACCSFDNIQELGDVCCREGIWLHVDAAYAGSALICPEFQYLLCGIEMANSMNFNPNKWMLVNFDCSLLWVKDKEALTSALTVDPLYLQHRNADRTVDFRHWGIPLSRRFRSLKLWFVIRCYGVEGLQKYIREHVKLAKLFEKFVLADVNYEVMGHVTMGLVCFRLKGPNSLTQKLLHLINESGKLHMIPALVNERYVIRFAICSQYACVDDITYAWKIITIFGNETLSEYAKFVMEYPVHNHYDNAIDLRRDSNKEAEKTDTEGTSEGDEDVFSDFEEEICFDQQRNTASRAKVKRSHFQRMTSDPNFLRRKMTFSQSIDLETRMSAGRRQSEASSILVSTPDYTFAGP